MIPAQPEPRMEELITMAVPRWRGRCCPVARRSTRLILRIACPLTSAAYPDRSMGIGMVQRSAILVHSKRLDSRDYFSQSLPGGSKRTATVIHPTAYSSPSVFVKQS
jgi:hypothetical protein